MTRSDDFAARLRWAYEWGRLKHAAGKTWMVPPLTAVSWSLCHHVQLSFVIGGGLFLLATSLIWYGRTAATAARSGLRTGVAAFVVPIIAFHLDLPACCDEQTAMFVINGGTGLGVGLLLNFESARVETQSNWFLSVASVVATLCGMLGCVLFGSIGLAGIAAGVLVSTAPVAIYRGATA